MSEVDVVKPMKYFIIVTDNNGRQYLFQIQDAGLNIQSSSEIVYATIENPQLGFILDQIRQNEPFIVGDTLFNSNNVTAVKLQAYPADEI